MIANRFREVILNGTWIANTNLKDQLEKINWQIAIKPISKFNTISLLTQHLHYYIKGILKVLEGGKLEIKDQFSFDFPPILSESQWQLIIFQLWHDSEALAQLIEKIPEEALQEYFAEEKYGSLERNLNGLIEHSYYHLGQIILLKKLLIEI